MSLDASPVQPFGNINVTDVITTESLPGDSEPCNIVANTAKLAATVLLRKQECVPARHFS